MTAIGRLFSVLDSASRLVLWDKRAAIVVETRTVRLVPDELFFGGEKTTVP